VQLVALLRKKMCKQWLIYGQGFAIGGSFAEKNVQLSGSFAEKDVQSVDLLQKEICNQWLFCGKKCNSWLICGKRYSAPAFCTSLSKGLFRGKRCAISGSYSERDTRLSKVFDKKSKNT